MKDITFHNSFSPAGATDSVTYNNGLSSSTQVRTYSSNVPLQSSPLEPVCSGLKPTKQQEITVCSSLEVSVQEQASVPPVAGFKEVVIVPSLRTTDSVPKIHSTVERRAHDRSPGVDNVLEITIVTADGNLLVANSYQNQDLFWALRGGGGGTWGVITSVSYKTHPSTPFAAALIQVNSTNPTSTQNLLGEIIRLTPSLLEQGYGGYGGGAPETFQFFVLSPNVTVNQTRETFRPLFDFAFSQPGLSVLNETTQFQDFWEFYNLIFNGTDGQVGVPSEISSWLLPKDVIQTNTPNDLAGELLKISGFGYL